MTSIVHTCNNSSNRVLKKKTPNEVYDNQYNQLARQPTDMVHNHNIYILEEKARLEKGNKNSVKKCIL